MYYFRAWKKSEKRMVEWDELRLMPNLGHVLSVFVFEQVMESTNRRDISGDDEQ